MANSLTERVFQRPSSGFCRPIRPVDHGVLAGGDPNAPTKAPTDVIGLDESIGGCLPGGGMTLLVRGAGVRDDHPHAAFLVHGTHHGSRGLGWSNVLASAVPVRIGDRKGPDLN